MMQPIAAIQPMPVLRQRFSHILVGLVGPLPTSREGFWYLFTNIDRMSKWLEAVPLPAVDAERCTDTERCVDALVGQRISSYSALATITLDQGAKFTSSLWAKTCKKLGMEHNTTIADHLQSNSMGHRHLKKGLQARKAATDWSQHLPWVLLNIRTAPKKDSITWAALMVYGTSQFLLAKQPVETETPEEEI